MALIAIDQAFSRFAPVSSTNTLAAMSVRRPPAPNRAPGPMLPAWLKRPQVLFPIAIVGGMLLVAFGLQPGGDTPGSSADAPGPVERLSPTVVLPTPTLTVVARSPTVSPTRPLVPTGTSAATNDSNLIADPRLAGGQSEVAGARATPQGASEPDLARQSTECGALQEVSMILSVEQTLYGVSLRATKASVFPIEYFRCILRATGGNDAHALATSIDKAFKDGSTHAVLIDVWVANSNRDFGQLNLKSSTLAAAGQVFSPLATLGGRAEVVVSGGQGRAVTIVVPVKESVGPTIGPVTLVAEAPLVGGKKTAGKYQLFLPVP